MKQRIAILALAAGCLIFAVAGALVYMGRDRQAPEITVKKADISYTEGEDYSVLMEGVTAEDNKDGDLTDQVFVDRIQQTGENSAIVYYGVMDKSNNVGTGKRTIEYYLASGTDQTQTDGQTEQDAQAEQEALAQQQQQEALAQQQQQQQQEQPLQPNGQRPALALTATETTIPVGTSFDPMSVVKDAVDDVDSRDTLYQRISANGIYDTNVPGTYVIQYFVTDTSGNTSDPLNFTLIVQ